MQRNFLRPITKIMLAVLCLLLLGCANEEVTQKERSVTDVRGTKIMLGKDKPQRILCIAKPITSIALSMVTTDKLVAVDALLDDPVSSNIVWLAERVPKKIRIPSIEEVMSLKPDVVFVSDITTIDYVQSLRNAGLPVIVCKTARTIEQVEGNIRLVADALGEKEKGELVLKKMHEEMAELERRVAQIPQEKRKKMLLLSLLTTYGGKGSLYDELCKRAGVVNAISAAGLNHGQELTKETIVKANPDIIFLPSYNDHGTTDKTEWIKNYTEDPSLQTVTAIREKEFRFAREGYIYNTSQDMVYGAWEIAYQVYGDAFKREPHLHISVSGEK